MNATVTKGFNGSEQCPRDTRIAQLVFPAIYTIVFLTSISLNTLALWVFIHIPSSSTFIVYLKSTLVADLVMTLMLPFKILSDSHLGPWQLRAFVCRFSAVIFYETMYVGIILLGLIAFDRFLKIIRPFGKFFVQKPTFAKTVSTFVWFLLFLISLPNMILSNQKMTPSTVKKCASLKSPLGLKWHQAVNYISQFIFWTVFALMLLFYVVIAKKVYDSYRKSKSKDSKNNKKLEAPALSSEGESQASSYALKGTEALEPAHRSGLIASLLFHPWNFTLFYKPEHARLFCPCAIAHVNLPLTHQENSYPALKSCVAIT
ncbi:P2Y purinoceptor 13 isoform X2 [Myotis yumanensis]|uniref:P2Y purinoceptor 13 isoform X2 n=1 Tax=Myotis yumanensis TaxID=159337 RepID=UPI0038D1EF1D